MLLVSSYLPLKMRIGQLSTPDTDFYVAWEIRVTRTTSSQAMLIDSQTCKGRMNGNLWYILYEDDVRRPAAYYSLFVLVESIDLDFIFVNLMNISCTTTFSKAKEGRGSYTLFIINFIHMFEYPMATNLPTYYIFLPSKITMISI